MEITRDEIPGLLEEIEEGTELFYQQRIPEALECYKSILEKISVVVEYMFLSKKENVDCELNEEKIQDIFSEILSAMEKKDYTLMADIITYDFIEYMEDLYKAM